MSNFLQGKGWPAAVVAVTFIVAYVLSLTLVPIRSDNDCWWHIKTGLYILEHGIPATDPFSFAAADHQWQNHEWLTQVGAAVVYRWGEASTLGGWRAVILATGLVLAAAFVIAGAMSARLSGSWWIALLVIAVAAGLGRRTYAPRPPAVSELMLAIELLILVGAHEGWWRRGWTWLLVPLFALWANLHGGWLAGLVVLGAFAGQDGLAWGRRHIAHPFDDAPAPLPLGHSLGLLAACVAATCLNPWSWQLYQMPARVLSETDLVSVIGELRPPDLFFTRDLIGAILATVLMMALGRRGSGTSNAGAVRAGELVLFLFFLFQALSHVRHLLLLGIVMVPFWTRLAAGAVESVAASLRDGFDGRLRAATPALVAVGVVAAAAAHAHLVLQNKPEARGYPARNYYYAALRSGYIRDAFPAAACDYIELVGFEGRMFNQNNFAGYLIWRLSPETHQVFSDPRFDIFGGAIWRDEEVVTRVIGGDAPDAPWRHVMDQWQIQWGIVRSTEALAQRLRAGTPGWEIVADFERSSNEPSEWVVFMRITPENAPARERAKRMFGQ